MNASKTVALLALMLAWACSKETPPAAEQARSPGGGAATTVAPSEPGTKPAAAVEPAQKPEEAASPSAGQAKFSDPNFELVLAPKGDYKAGQAGEAEILLTAKQPFHVNDKYPY